MKKIWFLAAVCLVAAVAAACGGSSTKEAASSSASATSTVVSSPVAASAAKVTIESFSFGQPLTVPAGAQISVTNKDPMEHSVTSDTKGVFDVDVEGGADKTFNAPNQPGEYPFHCSYHPTMKGVLTVK
jgi:plastocyanin